MSDVFTNTMFIFFVSIAAICVGPAVAHYWWKVQRDRNETELKRDMVAHGMSADEIIRVLQASRDGGEE